MWNLKFNSHKSSETAGSASGSGCCLNDETIVTKLDDGNEIEVNIKNLSIGDMIKTRKNEYSQVIWIIHHVDLYTKIVTLEFINGKHLKVPANHIIKIMRDNIVKECEALEVKENDCIISEENYIQICNVKLEINKENLSNVFTENGRIFANGFEISCLMKMYGFEKMIQRCLSKMNKFSPELTKLINKIWNLICSILIDPISNAWEVAKQKKMLESNHEKYTVE
jgi:hypothetical protein